jgi:hypothetical protein
MRPLFIFSAPRSGSTFVQRVLAAHSNVATASEPWLLLPLLAPLHERLPAAGSRDPLVHEALTDFIAELPETRASYLAAVRNLALRLYEQAAAEDVEWFVDKTPLYHLIVDDIVEAFPDGRFVFLFRNPLSVVASGVELWDEGRWEVSRYEMALFQAVADLVPASLRHRDRAISVRFEDLVTGGEEPWRAVTDHVGLEWEPSMLEQFTGVALSGRKGDPTGTKAYGAISREPLDKWKATIDTPVRQAWCRRYLRWIGRERLAVMGFDLDALLAEIDATPATGSTTADDARRLAAAAAREALKARLPAHSGGPGVWRALLRAR